jgi:tRNA/tmRNA/rRNA uracil-C5-methylase (TrmA/RlmC/RlmD family)
VNDTLMVGNTPVVLRRHVLAFFQGNRFLLNSLATDVVEQLAQAQSVIDLYAGVGLFSAAAAAGGAKVIAIEGDRVAAAD